MRLFVLRYPINWMESYARIATSVSKLGPGIEPFKQHHITQDEQLYTTVVLCKWALGFILRSFSFLPSLPLSLTHCLACPPTHSPSHLPSVLPIHPSTWNGKNFGHVWLWTKICSKIKWPESFMRPKFLGNLLCLFKLTCNSSIHSPVTVRSFSEMKSYSSE